jgi:hypothetical protein
MALAIYHSELFSPSPNLYPFFMYQSHQINYVFIHYLLIKFQFTHSKQQTKK